MAQFGSDTLITDRTRLIILDCFDTLVELEGSSYASRRGIVPFLRHFGVRRRLTLVVHSDGGPAQVAEALAQAGIEDFFAAIYHGENACRYDAEGRLLKCLDRPLHDFAIPPDEAVFIGDSRYDALAAQEHALPFIRVPRGEDREFSFERLITGTSRYDSRDFSDTFLRHWRK